MCCVGYPFRVPGDWHPESVPHLMEITCMSEEPSQVVSLQARCEGIELLVLDVDGVLTDGGIVYVDNDTEVKKFHVRDGSGLALWRKVGKRAAIVTGRRSK